MSEGVVAIVDDNISILDSLKFALEIHGYKVETYSSPTSFLDDLTTRPTCLIVDQNMPAMTGLELVARLRQDGNRIPVLLTTGLSSSDLAAGAARLDIGTVIEKPAELDVLLKFVSEYC
jgi:FixJ family two-component response regulator